MEQFDDPLDMSVHWKQPGERELAPLRERDSWWCRKCRHTFRRALVHGPVRWRCYATGGRVTPETACPACRKRIEALDRTRPEERIVGVRLRGVDA